MIKRNATLKSRLIVALQLIKLLQSESVKLKDICARLNISERTAYRYFNTIEEIGYILEKDLGNKYFIHTYAETNISNNSSKQHDTRTSN